MLRGLAIQDRYIELKRVPISSLKKSKWSSWHPQPQPYWSSGYATTTPPRRSTSYENVMSSPHGTDHHDITMPNDFKYSQRCLDENVIGGSKFFRKIQLTARSQKVNLSGRAVGDVRLHELCWQGWHNWHLRLLSAGQFVTVVFRRKVNEAALMSQLLTYIRERKRDIDQIAQAVGSSSNLPVASSSSSSENPKVQASQALANYIGSHLEHFANTVVENDKDRQIVILNSSFNRPNLPVLRSLHLAKPWKGPRKGPAWPPSKMLRLIFVHFRLKDFSVQAAVGTIVVPV